MKNTRDTIGNLDRHMSTFKVFIKEFFQLLLFNQGQGVDLSSKTLSIGDEFYDMVPFLPIQEFTKYSLAKMSLISW